MGVKGADPHLLDNRFAALAQLGSQTAAHLFRRFLGKCRNENSLRIGASGKKPRDPPGQNRGFAASRPGEHQAGAVIMRKRLQLLLVQSRFEGGQKCGGATPVQVFGNGFEGDLGHKDTDLGSGTYEITEYSLPH